MIVFIWLDILEWFQKLIEFHKISVRYQNVIKNGLCTGANLEFATIIDEFIWYNELSESLKKTSDERWLIVNTKAKGGMKATCRIRYAPPYRFVGIISGHTTTSRIILNNKIIMEWFYSESQPGN